ncbi:MAG: aspartate 1-decarboxylase [Candidatus Omnitrophica bacterium]|nr:aspartate 1-decarboxylase [Candidatus Omnitrophota bacterium]MDD5610232.1 aspartate 1-decarboxylase [Candidatus Omnitrophota bacterium]
MLRTILKSKIHRARITGVHLHYEGSLLIDEALLEKADIIPGEKIEVFNLNNGSRFETYAIKGKKGSGEVCLHGPAARWGYVGDEIIIVCYALIEEEKARQLSPKIVHVDEKNQMKG